jgi:hypothetical protein
MSDDQNNKRKDLKIDQAASESEYTAEELEFIKKIRGQIALEDDDSSTLVASFMKIIP